MNDGQKQTVNHIYHFLRDLLDKYENGTFLSNGRKPCKVGVESMIWYLETNFPKDMLEHEMGDRGFLNEDETYSEKMQDDLEPIEDDKDEHA